MTRMWNIPPNLLCRQHLLAEHRELHIMWGMINKGMWGTLRGLSNKMVCEPFRIQQRHNEIEDEMRQRKYYCYDGFGPIIIPSSEHIPEGFICPVVTGYELARRCLDCRQRQRNETYRPEHECDERCLDRATADELARPMTPTGLAAKPLR